MLEDTEKLEDTEISQEVSMHQNQKTTNGTFGFRYAIKKGYKSFTAEG